MASSFAERLLRWFDHHKRDLPWRRTRDPYAIWVSEVMLQQTQVDTVIPFYQAWLKQFPTLTCVAEATQERVLKAWEGLGYYSRARNFHSACQEVVRRHGAQVPDRPEDFAKLKGVGPYTLAAVQSIAFGHCMPVLDGNVKRVVARLLMFGQPPSKAWVPFQGFLAGRICGHRPGDFNQAMMELGAVVCRPTQPRCEGCPVRWECLAWKQNRVTDFPVSEPPKFRPKVKVSAGIIWRNQHILIAKRKQKGLLGGLWEFPGGKLEKGESPEACLRREIQEELNIQVEVGPRVCDIEHAYTHFSIELACFHCRYLSGEPRALGCDDWAWVRLSQLKDYPFPKSNHKIFIFLKDVSPFASGSASRHSRARRGKRDSFPETNNSG